MDSCLERFWTLDSVGINDCALIKDDDRALQKFQETVRFQDGRHEVKWLWKYDEPELSENYELSFGRLNSLVKRLEKAPDIMKKYNTIIQDQLEKGIIEKVTEQRIPDEGHIVLVGDKIARGRWKFGRIHKLITSRDGYVRSAMIMLPNKKLIQRPIKLLYPLENYLKKGSELKCDETDHIQATKQGSNSTEVNLKVQPKRRAGIEAKKSIKKVLRRECHDDS